MTPKFAHSWNLSEQEAITLQVELSSKVVTGDRFDREVSLVAGVDVAYSKQDDHIYAAAVVLDAATLSVVETKTTTDRVNFPYIPGLFSFREIPAIVKVLSLVEKAPDLIVCDGQGVAHPRYFGLASHLGVLFETPTIGCAKTRFFGNSTASPQKRGDYVPMLNGQEIIGSKLCTQDGVKPVYVSIGHRISLESARQWVLKLAPHYRLPETTRLANETVNVLRQSAL